MSDVINWAYVYMFLRDYDMIDSIDASTLSALRRYICLNPVSVREVAVMLSVYSVMSVDMIAKRLIAIAA